MLTEPKIMTHFCREERDTVDPVVIQNKNKHVFNCKSKCKNEHCLGNRLKIFKLHC